MWGNEKGGAPNRLRSQRVPHSKIHDSSYDNRTRNQGPHARNRIGTACLPRRGMSALCWPRALPAASAPPTHLSSRRRGLRPCFSLLGVAAEVPELPQDVYRLSALSHCVGNNLSAPRCWSGRRTFWGAKSRIVRRSVQTGGPSFMMIVRSIRWQPKVLHWRIARCGDGCRGWAGSRGRCSRPTN